MTLAIISPMHNEARNISDLAKSLNQQSFRDFEWFVVDDGSDDDTANLLRTLPVLNPPKIIEKSNDGGLIGGSAFSSWLKGVEVALASSTGFTHFMKLDADVRLRPEYLERIVQLHQDDGVGLVGGIILTSGMVEQSLHVPGPVKMYSRKALDVVLQLPRAIGFDIMDEVLLDKHSLKTIVDKSTGFELSRAIGASEGLIHGRLRNGRGCRWTGYSFPYFLLRCLRYFLRRPLFIGPFAMFWGYITAGPGPYDRDLKQRHASMQRAKLREAAKAPVRFYKRVYER